MGARSGVKAWVTKNMLTACVGLRNGSVGRKAVAERVQLQPDFSVDGSFT